MTKKIQIIGVIGSHEDDWPSLSYPLGRLICDLGYHLLTGAGGGVMTKVAKAFTESEDRPGKCIGIYPVEKNPDISNKQIYPNPYIEIPIIVPLLPKADHHAMPYSRNLVNVMSSDIVIALPGLHGTKTEVSYAIQIQKPLVLFGPEGEFQGFPQDPARLREIDEVDRFIRENIEIDGH